MQPSFPPENRSWSVALNDKQNMLLLCSALVFDGTVCVFTLQRVSERGHSNIRRSSPPEIGYENSNCSWNHSNSIASLSQSSLTWSSSSLHLTYSHFKARLLFSSWLSSIINQTESASHSSALYMHLLILCILSTFSLLFATFFSFPLQST